MEPPRFPTTAGAATLAAMAGGYPGVARADDAAGEKITPTADSVIVLWMAGGMAHTETFDPKRYTPFEKGMASKRGAQHVPRDRHGRR